MTSPTDLRPDAAPDDGLAGSLRAALRGAFGGSAPEVDGLERLTGGASRETWAFTAVAGGDEQSLVLQRERPGSLRPGGMVLEADLLGLASAAGVPVPEVVAAGPDGGPLGASWIVTRRVAGETVPRRILRAPELADARRGLARRAGEVLGQVHALPLDRADGLDRTDPLERFAGLLELVGEPHPALEVGLRRLRATRPDPRPPVLLHGDFRLGNLVVGPDGLRAVLDWELAHIGDPVEDLGWFCCRAWRFGSPLEAGGVGTVDDLLAGYAATSGRTVTSAELRWWQAFGALAWGVMCIVQAQTHRSGRHRSVELAMIGRRTAEPEEDLLELLFGPSDAAPSITGAAGTTAADAPDVHDPPTAVELLAAVSEYLRGDVMESTRGRTAFHARVAANVVDMVAREFAHAPSQRAVERARYSPFGAADASALVALVRAGDLDGRLDEVAAVLRGAVRDKLAVSRPGYWLGDAPAGSDVDPVVP